MINAKNIHEWQSTNCVLCPQNCGLEVKVVNNKIIKVRGDKKNPRSLGYICHKGLKIAHYQHNADRLLFPLRKKNNGSFERICWDDAIIDIAERLEKISNQWGPKAIAYVGGGGQGSHFESAYGLTLLRSLGSRYHYSSIAQELTGQFWVYGRAFGRQNLIALSDHERCDFLIAMGWNGLVSHQMPRAQKILKEISRDPKKLLVVVDPRRSETAQIADIHLAIRPGCDALLLKAMISIILQHGWQNQSYLNRQVTNHEQVVSWFDGFDSRAAIDICELDWDQVVKVTYEFTHRKSCFHADLGVLMNRHSTLRSYLEIILLTLCGRINVPGGNVFPGFLTPLGSHSDERRVLALKTVITQMPAIFGVFPPNVLPQEIDNNHPERLRAALVSTANPLRSYADSTYYRRSFAKLDLLVTIDIAMSETARVSDYVLPALSGYESWNGTFFQWNYPEIFFQMRQPVLDPAADSEAKDSSDIILSLATQMNLVPEIPAYLKTLEGKTITRLSNEIKSFVKKGMIKDKRFMKAYMFTLAASLGKALESSNLALLWEMISNAGEDLLSNARRIGYEGENDQIKEKMFYDIIHNAQGVMIGKLDEKQNFKRIAHPENKIELLISEYENPLRQLDALSEKKSLALPVEYPLVLAAGLHGKRNANTIFRDPSWIHGDKGCTLFMHPQDATKYKLSDGQMCRLSTKTGSVEIEIEISATSRPGHVIMPHGFGLLYDGKAFGVNANELTAYDNRDDFTATPLHRYIPCRVEALVAS